MRWWLEPDSNQRHADFQSAALPTELSSLYLSGSFRNQPPLAGRGGIKGARPDFDNPKIEKKPTFFRASSNRFQTKILETREKRRLE
jgi:hypothetical protein